MSQLSSTEPIMSLEGIEPVIAHYQTQFDQVRKDAIEQIRMNVSSAVDNLFDVYVNYMKTITTKVCSTLKNVGQNCEEKYVPLVLVESAVRVMQSNLRQLMDTEMEATSSKLSSLLKVPLCLPLKSNSHNDHDDEDDDDDQQDSEDSEKIISELEKNLEDISDIDDGDEEEEEEDGNEKSDKRKRNQQTRVTEHISREKIDQMCLLIRKLERVQIMEQAMLLRQLEKLKKKQQQSQASTSESHVTDYQTVPESRLTEPIGQQLSHSSATNSSISNSFSSSSTSVADQSQTSVSPVPKSTHLRLVQTEPGTFKLVRQESNDAISHSTNVSGAVSLYILKPRPLPSTTDTTPNQSQIQSSNASNQLSSTSNLPSSSSSPSEELSSKSVALLDDQGQNDESDDDEVIFLKEVPSTRTNQVGSSIRDGDDRQKSTQPVLEQMDQNIASIASECTPNLSLNRECNSIQNVVDMVLSMETNVSTVPSTSFPSTSNSFNNFGKRLLVRTSDESRPSKSPKSSVEPSSNANQSQDNANAITSQASTPTSGQLKPAKLDCPHCSDRFETRATLNSHILRIHKCSQPQTRQFHCAFVGCSVSRDNKLSAEGHIVYGHHQTAGDPCDYFDIVDI